jgi:hypothetical protein
MFAACVLKASRPAQQNRSRTSLSTGFGRFLRALTESFAKIINFHHNTPLFHQLFSKKIKKYL